MKSLANSLFSIVVLAQCASVGLADDSSLQTTDSESSEVTALVALEKLLAENRKLRLELDEVRKTAAANTAEAEIFKRQFQELSLRMEALGTSTADPSKLEQRLLQAVHDLQLSEKSRKALSTEALRIAELVHAHLSKPDAESKFVLETELKKVDEVIVQAAVGDIGTLEKKSHEVPSDILNGKVSAVEKSLNCVVINVGAKQGVKTGMPFKVRRGSKVIATLRVVDVRQGFAGTVIQNLVLDKEPIKLGDAVRVDAQLN